MLYFKDWHLGPKNNASVTFCCKSKIKRTDRK
jgi:hypothetical protein